jgi:predicted MFS family arabinose efflux permease
MIAFTANTLATVFIRDRNKTIRPSQLGFDTKLLRRGEVLLLLAWVFISMLGYVVLLFSLSDFALSIGLDRKQATDIIGLLNVGTAIGRPVIGVCSDRWSRMNTAGVLTLLCGVSCFVFWIPATGYGLTVFFVILCGAIVGVFWMVCRFPGTVLHVLLHLLTATRVDNRAALRGGSGHQGFAVTVVFVMGSSYHPSDGYAYTFQLHT